jgi:hypothetical protein
VIAAFKSPDAMIDSKCEAINSIGKLLAKEKKEIEERERVCSLMSSPHCILLIIIDAQHSVWPSDTERERSRNRRAKEESGG